MIKIFSYRNIYNTYKKTFKKFSKNYTRANTRNYFWSSLIPFVLFWRTPLLILTNKYLVISQRTHLENAFSIFFRYIHPNKFIYFMSLKKNLQEYFVKSFKNFSQYWFWDYLNLVKISKELINCPSRNFQSYPWKHRLRNIKKIS